MAPSQLDWKCANVMEDAWHWDSAAEVMSERVVEP